MRTQRQRSGRNLRDTDVLQHVAASLHAQWRRYRKRLRRCQTHFSEDAVHASRVETRRLLATVELLRAFLPEAEIEKARRALKRHLDTFDQLRDTQVQLLYVARLTEAFPTARAFQKWLRKRETRFRRQTRRAVRDIKAKRLGRRVATLEEAVGRLRRSTPQDRAFAIAQREIDRAFQRVASSCQRVKATRTATIHRTRIAFKRFRYMVEALAPLLPEVDDRQRDAMRGYQSMMGDIQDAEVLLAALDKFARKRGTADGTIGPLRAELVRRRHWLVNVYLNAAGRLRGFWSPPGGVLPTAARRPDGAARRRVQAQLDACTRKNFDGSLPNGSGT